MSGLLDKANETAKAAEKDEKVEPKIEVEVSDSKLDATILDTSDSGLDIKKLKFQLGSLFGFIITMILVFFVDTLVLFGDITLDDLFVPGIVIFWLLFNGSEIMEKDFDTTKLGVSAVAFLVLTGVFAGVAIFSTSSSNVTIANVEFDGDGDEIDLSFYGPKGMEYTVDVLVDSKVEYSYDGEINVNKDSHSVSLDDFWKGNSEDKTGKELIDYEIRVTSNGEEDSMEFNDIMNREVDTAFISVLEKYTYENNGDNKIYEGIYVEMIVGMGMPNANFDFDDGIFSGTEPMPIESDWSATVRVLGGDAIVSYEITADEGVANGYGDFNFDWVSLYMNGGYLEKGDFYGDDGCYTFEITIENEHGATFVSTDSQIQFFWDDNEASNGDRPAEAC